VGGFSVVVLSCDKMCCYRKTSYDLCHEDHSAGGATKGWVGLRTQYLQELGVCIFCGGWIV